MDVLLCHVGTNIMPQSMYQYIYASVLLTYVCERYVCIYVWCMNVVHEADASGKTDWFDITIN